MFPRVGSRQRSPWFVAKTYHAERLKRYPRDKNVYHDHDNCPELNPLHEMANQSHSEGPLFRVLQLFKCATCRDPTGFLLSSTRQDGPGRLGGVEHRPEPATELLELELRLRPFT